MAKSCVLLLCDGYLTIFDHNHIDRRNNKINNNTVQNCPRKFLPACLNYNLAKHSNYVKDTTSETKNRLKISSRPPPLLPAIGKKGKFMEVLNI